MRICLIVTHTIVFLIGIQLGNLLCLTRNNCSKLHDRFDIDIDSWPVESTEQNKFVAKNTSSKEISVRDLNNNDKELNIRRGMKFCLIHVGKTGGRSIACELGEGQVAGIIGRDLLCYRYNPAPSALKRAFAGRSHVWGKGCESKQYSAFIYTLRNPLERLISWYFYENPMKYAYAKKKSCSKNFFKQENSSKGCFSDLEDFALHTIPPATIHDNLDATINNITRSNCTELAWQVATGEQKCYAHNGLGYSYYYRRMQQLEAIMKRNYPADANKQILMLAIRTEHLIHDWDTLDQAFGGKDWKPNGHKRFTNKPKSQDKFIKTSSEISMIHQLSRQARNNLCHALCFEIQVYKTMLHMAKNLNETEVRKSIQEVIDSCPNETFEVRDCPSSHYAQTLYDSYAIPFKDPFQCQCKISTL